MNPDTPPPHMQSFETQLSRVRLWTVIPAVFVPVLVWRTLARQLGVSESASQNVQDLLLWACALGWWTLKAAARPYSVRATLGRPLDLAGWGVLALALFGETCIRIVWFNTAHGREILGAFNTGGSYSFRLQGTYAWDFVRFSSMVVLAPLIEELLFRGTLFRSCRVRFGPSKAALLSSVIFGALHPDSLSVFVSALTYVLAYTRTRSLWAPLLLHCLNNGVWFALTERFSWEAPELVFHGRWQFGSVALVLLLGVGVWVHFVRKSWRTLGDPLPPESLHLGSASPPSLPAPLHAGR